MKYTAINFKDKLSKFSDHWAPRVVAELNNYQVLLVEPGGTVNTGDTGSILTADNDVWI